jgi:hypothetical protein
LNLDELIMLSPAKTGGEDPDFWGSFISHVRCNALATRQTGSLTSSRMFKQLVIRETT